MRSPSLIYSRSVSSVGLRGTRELAARARACRCSAICRTVRSSLTTRNVSPAAAPPADRGPGRAATGRPRGPGRLLVEHRADATVRHASHDRVADAQRAPLDQDRCHRAAALGRGAPPALHPAPTLDRSLELRATRPPSGRPPPGALDPGPLRAETSTNIVSPPYSSATSPYSVSCWRTLAGFAPSLSTLFTATTIGTLRRLGVVERLDRLRLHAVVGGHHQDRDVRHLGTTGTHGGERLVAGGVDERDDPADASTSACTWYAPMCWVMPPASLATTSV